MNIIVIVVIVIVIVIVLVIMIIIIITMVIVLLIYQAGGGYRQGEDTVDRDAVGSNCSIENCLCNFNKRTSSKSSNREL